MRTVGAPPIKMQSLPWIVAIAVLALFGVAILAWTLGTRRSKRIAALPTEWSLTARPVFSPEERRVYRLLREALPHHIVLSKLPLVRFCQPTNANDVRYWFELLGSIHVTFAVCSANGRVLAAVDLDHERGHSTRVQQIKHAVLAACRVRYLRCPYEHLPSVAELQLLVPQSATAPRGPLSAQVAMPALNRARDTLASTVANRRASRTTPLWQDSTVFQDSFFAPPNQRPDGFAHSEYENTPAGPVQRSIRPAPMERTEAIPGAHDIVGVVIDRPRAQSRSGT